RDKMAIELISKMKPKNNGDFALMDAEDIAFKEGRLDEYMPVVISKADFEVLKTTPEYNPKTPYLVYEE
ncbi:MAG: hypothetical protein IJD80_04040, partial [Oscillospiraceae bacterium]|nr:hypothetical protein [Oscillospiraceae bacterium]